MEQVLGLIRNYYDIIVFALLVLTLVVLLFSIINWWRTGRVIKRFNRLMLGTEDKNLEEMLTAYLHSVEQAVAKTQEVEGLYRHIRQIAEMSIQKVGIIRYNAFNDTGSDQSFAVALLDYRGDGVVISSLFGRNETRTYAKPVESGKSSYLLSEEEEQAIRQALNKTLPSG